MTTTTSTMTATYYNVQQGETMYGELCWDLLETTDGVSRIVRKYHRDHPEAAKAECRRLSGAAKAAAAEPTTSSTMTIEAAGYIVRRKPQTTREHEIAGEAWGVLGRAGYSDQEARMQAQRELSRAELAILDAARSC
jgi:hypothetical protein